MKFGMGDYIKSKATKSPCTSRSSVLYVSGKSIGTLHKIFECMKKLVCIHRIDCFVISRCMGVCSIIILLFNRCVNGRFVSTVNEHQDGSGIQNRRTYLETGFIECDSL